MEKIIGCEDSVLFAGSSLLFLDLKNMPHAYPRAAGDECKYGSGSIYLENHGVSIFAIILLFHIWLTVTSILFWLSAILGNFLSNVHVASLCPSCPPPSFLHGVVIDNVFLVMYLHNSSCVGNWSKTHAPTVDF